MFEIKNKKMNKEALAGTTAEQCTNADDLTSSQPIAKPNVICSGGHTWDKLTGIREAGRPHIGIKSKWVRTCQKCGKREVFSSGIFNGWFSE